jgi:hypothetical protein
MAVTFRPTGHFSYILVVSSLADYPRISMPNLSVLLLPLREIDTDEFN